MQQDFWLQRWDENQIGFHQDTIHLYLIKYFSQLDVPTGGLVFVPLCGKSLDMLWISQQGYQVVGVELSQKAVEAFFEENSLYVETEQTKDFLIYRNETITLYCGDFFQLKPEHLADCAAVYDRASLIALPPDMRTDYVQHKRLLFPAGLDTLLITLDYDQEEMDGPPFSVTGEEVQNLYLDDYSLETLQRKDIIEEEEHFQSKGVSAMYETAYLLSPR